MTITVFEKIITFIFGCGLIFNAILFIPQALRIYKTKSSKDLSLITFVGFTLTLLAAVAYGFIQKDNVLIFGYLISLLTCGAVTLLIFIYRR